MSGITDNIASLLLQQGAKAPSILQLPDGGEKVVVIPNGMSVQSMKHFCPPQRIEQTVTLLEAGSFIEYVNRFKDGDTLIFAEATATGVTFRAALDYHMAKDRTPRHVKHSAYFAAIETPEWQVWSRFDRQFMSQLNFATFLEDNQQLFVEPKGADLLELVRTLHGSVSARFNTSLRLETGAHSVSYEEDVVVRGQTGTTKTKDMTLPPEIVAGFAVFQGAAPYKIKARLKSRVQDKQLILFYETIQKHAIVRESILLLVKQIAEKTGITPLLGKVN